MVAKTASQAVFVHNERERETRDYNHPLMAFNFTIRWTDNLFTLHLNYRFDSIAILSQINNYNTRDTYIYIATAAIDQQHRPHRPFKLSRPLRNMSWGPPKLAPKLNWAANCALANSPPMQPKAWMHGEQHGQGRCNIIGGPKNTGIFFRNNISDWFICLLLRNKGT